MREADHIGQINIINYTIGKTVVNIYSIEYTMITVIK